MSSDDRSEKWKILKEIFWTRDWFPCLFGHQIKPQDLQKAREKPNAYFRGRCARCDVPLIIHKNRRGDKTSAWVPYYPDEYPDFFSDLDTGKKYSTKSMKKKYFGFDYDLKDFEPKEL